MSITLGATEVHRETYRDREIAIYSVPATTGEHWSRPAHLEHTIDGRDGARTPKGSAAQVAKKLRAYIDEWIADAEILPRLQAVIANATVEGPLGRSEFRSPASFDELPIGGTAWVYAMGQRRRGIVTAHGKTRVEVAYTTVSNPTAVYRKSVPLAQAWI